METAKPTQLAKVPAGSTITPIDGDKTIIWYPRGERLIIDAAQYAAPDRRDEYIATLEKTMRQAMDSRDLMLAKWSQANERIAVLEAALRKIRTLAGEALAYVFLPPDELVETIQHIAANALAGEAQPTSTVDEVMAI